MGTAMTYRPELTFIRMVASWRFWAFGYYTNPSRSKRGTIITLGLGPLRWQFIKWKSADADRAIMGLVGGIV